MRNQLVSVVLISCLTCASLTSAATIEELSRKFLGIPYGSGAHIVDKELIAPSYDCMTFTETVMALYLASKEEPAHKVLNRIRYFNGKRDEAFRKHFVETDWISDNQRLGFVSNITKKILPSAPSVTAIINKSVWFAKVHPELAASFEKSGLPKQIDATLDFIPLDSIPDISSRIPDAAIILFIQDNENKQLNYMKTPLLVGHMGFAVIVDGLLMLRQADSRAKIINDTDFAKAMVTSKKNYRGIAVMELQKK